MLPTRRSDSSKEKSGDHGEETERSSNDLLSSRGGDGHTRLDWKGTAASVGRRRTSSVCGWGRDDWSRGGDDWGRCSDDTGRDWDDDDDGRGGSDDSGGSQGRDGVGRDGGNDADGDDGGDGLDDDGTGSVDGRGNDGARLGADSVSISSVGGSVVERSRDWDGVVTGSDGGVAGTDGAVWEGLGRDCGREGEEDGSELHVYCWKVCL